MSLFSTKGSNIEQDINALGYMAKRNLITNALHNRPVNFPYTNKEIIAFARREDADSWLGINASSTSLAGFDNDVLFIGKPATDPETGLENTSADQSGLFDKAGDAIKGNLVFLGFGVVGIFLFKDKFLK